MTSQLPPEREGIDALLAKNLAVARMVRGFTQQQLADAAMVSRATIAQLETGSSDPRLSTVVELAAALNLPTIFLLLGLPEVQAFATLLETFSASGEGADGSATASPTGKALTDNGAPADLGAPPYNDSQPAGAAPSADSITAVSRQQIVPLIELTRMKQYVRSGMLKDRLRAARVGAEVARSWGAPSPIGPVSAGIFSAFLPGPGTIAGATLAELIERQRS
jgi:transcriptional regulator with XRE-family HTH domain